MLPPACVVPDAVKARRSSCKSFYCPISVVVVQQEHSKIEVQPLLPATHSRGFIEQSMLQTPEDHVVVSEN